MSKKAEAFLQFLQAASSLAKQGVKKSEILKFAKLQFGKVTDEITKAVDNIFEKSPLEKILDRRKTVKRSVEERKVLDMEGNVLDPNQPIIGGKQDKGITTLETEFTPTQAAEDIFPSGDYKYDMEMAAESYVENNPGMFKNKLYEDLDQKTQMEVYEKVSKIINQKNAEKIKAKKANPESKPKGFQLNVEKFVQDFPVSKEEAIRISKLPTEEQETIIKTYLDEDFSRQITLMDFDITKRKPNAAGGRAGYYGGGQAMIEPDLSDIGHGSDALMSRTRITAPGSQATTSTGLNYLLGEDNDNTRIPFNEGLLVPPKKPYTPDMFEDDSMTLLKGMYGTGKDSNEFLYNEMIKKGNILRNQGVERETVIEIIRNNKDKINAFLETQTTSPKSFEGLESFEMKADGGRIGYATKGKVSLSDLESLKGLKSDNSFKGSPGILGAGMPDAGRMGAKRQSDDIKNKVIGAFTYAVKNLDQETASYVKSLFNDKLQVGYETTMSGIKQDVAGKTGLVPIDDETIYKAIVNLDLPQDVKLKMSAISNKAGDEKIKASLKSNNLGLTWDNDKQEIIGTFTQALSPDGSLTITPIMSKDQDSNVTKDLQIDKAFDNGTLKFSINESDILNNKNIATKYDGENVSFFASKNQNDSQNKFTTGATAKIPYYLLNSEEKPTISFNLDKNLETGFESKKFSADFPLTKNLGLYGIRTEDDGGFNNNTSYGLQYNFKKDIGDYGNFYTNANIDNQGDYGIKLGLRIPFNKPEKRAFSFQTNDPKEALDMYKQTDGFKKEPGNERMPPPMMFAQGGIAGLRQGYSKGKGVDQARRGFLKILGGTVGAIAAFKTGALKLLGKTATTKAIPEVVKIAEGSGAPAWFEPMVNKVLADGLDITKKNATMDGQVVKSLDTPTGKVEVNYDTRSGSVDVNYSGENTALGEGVDMRYTVNQADEATKVKPGDDFEAVESIPEGQMSSPNDYNVEFAENATSDVKSLYSDTSELAELGGQKPLIKDISNTIKKKQTLKKMNDNPDQFASDNLSDDFPNYDYDDVNPNYD